jgi:hypothetical protein
MQIKKRGDEIKKISSPLKLLKIEQFWPFEEISIFSNGGHFGYKTALTDTILKGDHPLRWSPFKIVSVSAVLYPRWPPLQKKLKFLQMAKTALF